MDDDLPSAWQLEQAMSALMQAREKLLLNEPDLVDDEAELSRLLSTIEGGNALDVLCQLVRAAMLAENRAAATAGMLARLKARRARYVRREETLRTAILAALQALDRAKLEAPDFTVFRRAGGRVALVTDVEQLPDEFVRVTRSARLLELREALGDGLVIDGAVLANGGDVLTIKST